MAEEKEKDSNLAMLLLLLVCTQMVSDPPTNTDIKLIPCVASPRPGELFKFLHFPKQTPPPIVSFYFLLISLLPPPSHLLRSTILLQDPNLNFVRARTKCNQPRSFRGHHLTIQNASRALARTGKETAFPSAAHKCLLI